MSFWNWAKSTSAMWLIGIPVTERIVLIASRGPPNWYAALIFCVP